MSSGLPINGLPPLPYPGSARQKTQLSYPQGTFKELLSKELQTAEGLQVSKHAEKRLHSRDVDISSGEWQKIADKVSEAKDKGIKDSVVLTDKAALVVSAENNTVITAMTRTEAADHIFTNINGTIVI